MNFARLVHGSSIVTSSYVIDSFLCYFWSLRFSRALKIVSRECTPIARARSVYCRGAGEGGVSAKNRNPRSRTRAVLQVNITDLVAVCNTVSGYNRPFHYSRNYSSHLNWYVDIDTSIVINLVRNFVRTRVIALDIWPLLDEVIVSERKGEI